MGYLEAVEARLQDAIAAGHFSGLPGEGKPLPHRPGEHLAGDNWLGFKVLQNADLLPEWLNRGRDIEIATEDLRRLDDRHRQLAAAANATGDWESVWLALRRTRDAYAEQAYALRALQERFNWDAPGYRTQRPPIWVEYHLERLDSRLSMPIRPSPGCP